MAKKKSLVSRHHKTRQHYFAYLTSIQLTENHMSRKVKRIIFSSFENLEVAKGWLLESWTKKRRENAKPRSYYSALNIMKDPE